jgi:hypothetical protein
MKKSHSSRRMKATITRSNPGIPLILRARLSSFGSTFVDNRNAGMKSTTMRPSWMPTAGWLR